MKKTTTKKKTTRKRRSSPGDFWDKPESEIRELLGATYEPLMAMVGDYRKSKKDWKIVRGAICVGQLFGAVEVLEALGHTAQAAAFRQIAHSAMLEILPVLASVEYLIDDQLFPASDDPPADDTGARAN